MVGNGKGLNMHPVGASCFYSSSKFFFLNNILHVPHIKKISFQFINSPKIIMSILNFTHLFSVSRINPRESSCSKARVIMAFTLYNGAQSFLTLLLFYSMSELLLINGTIILAITLSVLFSTFYQNTI